MTFKKLSVDYSQNFTKFQYLFWVQREDLR